MTTETETHICESNTFATSPDGYSVHFKIAAEFGTLIPMTEGLCQHLKEAGYAAGAPQRKPNGAKADEPAEDAVACDFCGGPTWDNRKGKRNPKGPDYKCRDKDKCGAAAWINTDKETGDQVLRWREGQ